MLKKESPYGHFLGCKCFLCDSKNKDIAEIVKDAKRQLDNCWGHHQDGSDLIVDQSKLFSIIFNVAIPALERAEKKINGMNKDKKTGIEIYEPIKKRPISPLGEIGLLMKNLNKKEKLMFRKTVCGRTFAPLKKEAKIEIKTKAPSKWIFIDVEDCNVYVRDTFVGTWKGASDEQLDEAMKVLRKEKHDRK